MRKKRRQYGVPPVSSNDPGNPLRGYRMSMLAHGFVDDSDRSGFKLDDSDPMSYSVVRMRDQVPLTAAGITALVVIAVIVIAVVYLV